MLNDDQLIEKILENVRLERDQEIGKRHTFAQCLTGLYENKIKEPLSDNLDDAKKLMASAQKMAGLVLLSFNLIDQAQNTPDNSDRILSLFKQVSNDFSLPETQPPQAWAELCAKQVYTVDNVFSHNPLQEAIHVSYKLAGAAVRAMLETHKRFSHEANLIEESKPCQKTLQQNSTQDIIIPTIK